MLSPMFLLPLVSALLAGAVPAATNRTTEAGEATITDPTAECTPYDYPPLDALTANFPPNWVQPAVLLPNDAAANALWNQIKPQIPTDIAPRGTVQGDFSGVSPPYTSADPYCWWTWDQCTTPKLAGLKPDITGVPEPQTLGYGFDDGPNCSHNAFYDFLTEQKQKATMFYIGSNVQNWPLEAQRAIADGHEICVHTWSHPYMTAVDSEGAFAELYYAREMIRTITGVTPLCWRPPYGDVDDRIRSIAAALNLTTIIWQYDSFDYNGPSVQAEVDQNYENLIARAKNGTFATEGTIMLTHELTNFTMQTAVTYYPQLKAAFKYLVPVGVGMNWTSPYVETNYSLPSFAQYISGQLTSTGSSSVSSSAAESSATGTGTATSASSSASASGGSGGAAKTGAGAVTADARVGAMMAAALVAAGALVV